MRVRNGCKNDDGRDHDGGDYDHGDCGDDHDHGFYVYGGLDDGCDHVNGHDCVHARVLEAL